MDGAIKRHRFALKNGESNPGVCLALLGACIRRNVLKILCPLTQTASGWSEDAPSTHYPTAVAWRPRRAWQDSGCS
jgi:hypothetical protein